jgi:hypothetical protein
MSTWRTSLRYDPVPRLLNAPDPALIFFVRRDVLDEPQPEFRSLWDLPEAQRLLARQRQSGAWEYPKKGGALQPYNNFAVLETWRSLGILIDMYAYDRSHPAIEHAAAYLYSCQSPQGDLRGILGNQYMPYYHSAIMEILVKAGFADDRRVRRGLDWLLTMRQDDGGWIIPAQALPASKKTHRFWRGAPLPPDRALPFSHLATGMGLRGLVAHPAYRARPEVRAACMLLKSRMFEPDRYNDRRGREYWLKFQYPFWWPNILTVLEMVARLGVTSHDSEVAKALAWFLDNQRADGLWDTGYGHGSRAARMECWVALSICRVLRAFLG